MIWLFIYFQTAKIYFDYFLKYKSDLLCDRLRHPNIVLVMGISLVDIESKPRLREESMDQDPRKKDVVTSQKTVCIITEFLEQV